MHFFSVCLVLESIKKTFFVGTTSLLNPDTVPLSFLNTKDPGDEGNSPATEDINTGYQVDVVQLRPSELYFFLENSI